MRASALLVVSLLLGACVERGHEPAPEAPLTSQTQAIVNGDRERGYPAVGAMVRPNGGAFCTGTLIRGRWVLTAAHCFNGGADPDNVFFYVGDRAGGDGQTYAASAVHRHPRWSGDVLIGIYDIALVRLAEAVPDVEPFGLFGGPTAPLVDSPLFFVGFGANQGDPARGSGVKRSTNLRLRGVTETMLFSEHDGTGVCFGDSGGPALVQQGDRWMVVGVNSSVRGVPACLVESLQVRVDAFRPWLRSIMGDDIDCGIDPVGQCGCADACLDGVCDPLLCQPQIGCRALIQCLNACQGESICQTACYGDAAPDARGLYDAVTNCAAERCEGAEDRNACVAERCPLDACLSDLPPGDGDCRDVLECSRSCADGECQFACFSAGDLDARAQYEALSTCIGAACGGLSGVDYQRCAVSACTDAWHACLPPDDCAITGGDCAAGTACRPESWTGLYCQPTADLAVGEECQANGRIVCQDGSLCDSRGRDVRCRAICLDAELDCGPGQECSRLLNQPIMMGVCTGCVDTDLDGDCDETDCAPDDPGQGAGHPEVCSDGIDQDCDGQADEDCELPDMAIADAGPRDAAVIDVDAAGEPEPVADAGVDMQLNPRDGMLDAPQPPPVVTERPVRRDDGCRAAPGDGQGGWWGLLVLWAIRRRRAPSPS